MKQKLTAAFIAAASILFFSCSWFQTKKQDNSNPLIGQWKLDSLHCKDTSLAFLLSYSALKDSGGVVFDFKKDTVITIADNTRDTSRYTWNEKEKHFIPADTIEGHFQFVRLDDSTVTLTSKDSTVYFLQKR